MAALVHIKIASLYLEIISDWKHIGSIFEHPLVIHTFVFTMSKVTT